MAGLSKLKFDSEPSKRWQLVLQERTPLSLPPKNPHTIFLNGCLFRFSSTLEMSTQVARR